ncbi:MAG: response regulator transcription factor [bacterium]|nr:response regulator transcription factor [bacterium]
MILVIEDSEDLNKMVREALEDASYKVDSSFTGMDGLAKLRQNTYELVLLDLMLPFTSGDRILKEFREFSDTPVIIISAKDMVTTKIDLLRLGADDYLTKPFDLGELLARVESIQRRVHKKEHALEKVTYEELTLVPTSKRAYVGKQEVILTPKEYLLLELLLVNKGQVFTKSSIYEKIWGEEFLGDDNAIKTHISNLRSKLKKAGAKQEYIETVWGLGYRLNTKQ